MDINVALNRTNRRDLVMNVGDTEHINLTVYREDGDDTPLTTEVANPVITFQPELSMSIPVGQDFTVPDSYDRVWYRLSADIDGAKKTLCSGVLWVKGAQCWPGLRWDYGGPFGWGWLL